VWGEGWSCRFGRLQYWEVQPIEPSPYLSPSRRATTLFLSLIISLLTHALPLYPKSPTRPLSLLVYPILGVSRESPQPDSSTPISNDDSSNLPSLNHPTQPCHTFEYAQQGCQESIGVSSLISRPSFTPLAPVGQLDGCYLAAFQGTLLRQQYHARTFELRSRHPCIIHLFDLSMSNRRPSATDSSLVR
jgi:hypothetical protein